MDCCEAEHLVQLLMRQPLIPKEEILLRLLEEFRCSGFDGATMSRISTTTGLGKASLYHHFPGGKEEMVVGVLRIVESWIETRLVSELEGEGDPRRRLRKALRILSEFYDNGKKSCIFDVLSVGQGSSEVRNRIKGCIGRILSGFEKIGVDLGFSQTLARQKAEHSLSILQGGLIMSRSLQDTAVFGRQLKFIDSLYRN